MSGVREALRDLLKVAVATFRIERLRWRQGPASAVAMARAWGGAQPARAAADRVRLLRIIRLVDAIFPGRRNCYRRALVEMSLDPQAARQPLRLGIMAAGGPRTGHAWLPHESQTTGRSYDAELVV